MCGISGIINKSGKSISKDEIKKMNDLIIHRGPDDEGYYFGKNFAFGHRRLAILDLSKAGHQPMNYKGKNGEYVITYNGEIYNFLELRKELIKDGYKFKSNTDTEVILASYDKWGEKCVNKFNGMWAFAIYDKKKDVIFCSRDRFGKKPFYYTEINGKFIFGSEIKQLLIFHKERYVNKSILLDYLIFGLEEHTDETFFEKIYKLQPSQNLIYNLRNNIYYIKNYYHLNINEKMDKLNEEETVRFLKEKLYNSVNIRLRSDVRVGTCLSGGLDSSSIAAFASKIYQKKSNQKLIAIHAKSIESKTDESYYAKEVAKHCDLNLYIVEPSLKDINNHLEEVIYTQEEPFGSLSIFMQYFVMKKAKEVGCKVMLDGQGGDETLFGYESYFPIYLFTLLKNFKLLQYMKDIKNFSSFKLPKRKIIINSILYPLRNKLLMWHLKKNNNVFLPNDYNIHRLNDLFTPLDFKNFQCREIFVRNLPHLLKYEDKNSMRHSIETRLPFVDYEFVESAISINDSLKVKNGYLKYALRKVVKDVLPENIVWRTNKFGFEAPTDLWIEKYKDKMVKTIESSKILNMIVDISSIKLNNKKSLWRLYNVAVWEKIYNVNLKI